MHQRLRHCERPRRSKDLHRSVVSLVTAAAQADSFVILEPHLSDAEKDVARRGRNKAGRGPRHGHAATYGKATGFETIIGWLFLKNPSRLAELLDFLEEYESDQL